MASAWGSQNIISMARYSSMAVASAMRRDLGSGVWIIALRAVPERRARSWGSGFNLHLREPAEPRTIKAIVGAALNGR